MASTPCRNYGRPDHGFTSAATARRGVFRADEGHTGGRYFLDAKRSVTLHIVGGVNEVTVGGVNEVTEQLTFGEGADPELKPSEQAAAVSKWVIAREGFGNWGALHLGSAKKDVLANLGEPQKKASDDEWTYESTCACELPEYFTLKFRQGRVVQLALSAED